MSTHELDELLLHLRGLVLVRQILAQRGATAEELDQHTAEIERVRDRLAQLVRESELLPAA
jgi:hypothetical protein